MEIEEIFNRLDKLRDDLLARMDHLESEIKNDVKDHKMETREDIHKLWDDQRRQDDCVSDVTGRKNVCMSEVDHKLETTKNSWWKKFAIICSILMSVICGSFVYSTNINNQINRTQEKIRVELESIKIKQIEQLSKTNVYNQLLQDHLDMHAKIEKMKNDYEKRL